MSKEPLRVLAVRADPHAAPGDLVGALAALLIDRARSPAPPRPPGEGDRPVTWDCQLQVVQMKNSDISGVK
jgi:hypothetical protein